jgi:hypothetical protein
MVGITMDTTMEETTISMPRLRTAATRTLWAITRTLSTVTTKATVPTTLMASPKEKNSIATLANCVTIPHRGLTGQLTTKKKRSAPPRPISTPQANPSTKPPWPSLELCLESLPLLAGPQALA